MRRDPEVMQPLRGRGGRRKALGRNPALIAARPAAAALNADDRLSAAAARRVLALDNGKVDTGRRLGIVGGPREAL